MSLGAVTLVLLLFPTGLVPYDSRGGGGGGRVRKKSKQHLLGSRRGSEKKCETRLKRTTVWTESSLVPNLH